MRPILFMLKKEFIQVFRTREMLAILFMVPIIQLLVLGYALTTDVKHVSVIVSDQDNSVVSREIIRSFMNTDRFEVVGFEDDLEIIGENLVAWKAQMAIIIPPHFQRDLRRGLRPQLQIIVDGIDGNTAGVALGYMQGILTHFLNNKLEWKKYVTVSSPIGQVEMKERFWYNMDLKSAQYMIPGIVVVLLTIVPMMLTSMSLVREKEIGTLEQLMVSPLKRYQLLLGKLIPFLILAFIELGIVLKIGQWIFSVEMAGSYVLLGGLSLLYLFTTLGLGIFVSTITGTQQEAMFLSWFFMVFMILMSGFFIPIENMPDLLQKATFLNPMRYFMYIIRNIFQKGSTFPFLTGDVLPMSVLGFFIFSFSIAKFQKRVG